MMKAKDIFSKIEHETPVKVALKDKQRMKSFLKFSLPPKKFNILDFKHFEYVDTEVLQKILDKKSRRRFRKIRGDIIIKVGLKNVDTQMLICIIVEHKSSVKSVRELFFQILDYNQALIEVGECPAMNVCLFHGKTPLNMPADLKAYLGWTPKMREILEDSGLNCGVELVDLNQKLDEDIKENAGFVSGLCFTLKHIWDLTKDKMRSGIDLILRDRVNPESDRSYKAGLSAYMLQASDCDREALEKLEEEVIKDKEERFMLSTYDRAINEGLQKGLQEGRQEGLKSVILNMLKKNMDISTIMECTGLSKEQVLELQK